MMPYNTEAQHKSPVPRRRTEASEEVMDSLYLLDSR